MRRYYHIAVLLLSVVYACTTSCVSTKNLLYYRDLPDTFSAPVVLSNVAPYTDPKIQVGDNLSINIQTLAQNPGDAPINAPGSGSGSSFNYLNGYLVDKDGYVELKLVGFVKVAGLTTTEARELIKQKADLFYKSPVVNVRIANFEVAVLGDVSKPGMVNLQNEKVGVFDAIALAGDLNPTAKRNNVLLVRSEGDKRVFVRLDLTSKNVYQSDYYWLRQRDQLYVEPNRYKLQSSDQTFIRNLGIITSVISLASLVLLFKNLK